MRVPPPGAPEWSRWSIPPPNLVRPPPSQGWTRPGVVGVLDRSVAGFADLTYQTASPTANGAFAEHSLSPQWLDRSLHGCRRSPTCENSGGVASRRWACVAVDTQLCVARDAQVGGL